MPDSLKKKAIETFYESLDISIEKIRGDDTLKKYGL